MSKYVGFRVGNVHESHVFSEYYCGECGYPVTDHDSFCPECGGAFRKCDASDLEVENAKLRELASGMYGLLELYDKITGNNFACETKRPMIFGEDKSFKDVMCELRIEVR